MIVEPPSSILPRLTAVLEKQGLVALAEKLARLDLVSTLDLRTIDAELARLQRAGNVVERSASHLLGRGGTRLRPLLVALATRLGSGFDERGVLLAVAVEMVHSATLLHDDVVDLGDKRRGAEAARIVYGNAASIFAGDWLLIEALRRVRGTGLFDVLDRLLSIIDEMIGAEALQLERRGSFDANLSSYFRVIEGKTASQFRWSMFAGGSAGGLVADTLTAAEQYGHHLGVAFQLLDDMLDFDVTEMPAEKPLLADLREGKMTYPLLLAIDRDASLKREVEEFVRGGATDASHDSAAKAIVSRVVRTGALEDTRARARGSIEQARQSLLGTPVGEARTLLDAIAEATLYRQH